jgi:hypothetical protein
MGLGTSTARSWPSIIKALAVATIAAAATGCTTTHLGPPETLSDEPLDVSCAQNPNVDAEGFVLVTCTFENTSSTWLDVGVASATLDGAKLSSPADTRAFAEAEATRQTQSRYDTDFALAGLLVGGLVLATTTHGSASDIGLAVASGASSAVAGRAIRDGYRDAQYGALGYGADHLLSESFRVPPHAFLRRSALFELAAGRPAPGTDLRLCFEEPSDACLPLNLGRRGRYR